MDLSQLNSLIDQVAKGQRPKGELAAVIEHELDLLINRDPDILPFAVEQLRVTGDVRVEVRDLRFDDGKLTASVEIMLPNSLDEEAQPIALEACVSRVRGGWTVLRIV